MENLNIVQPERVKVTDFKASIYFVVSSLKSKPVKGP
jgi:hypothetical protein